MFTSLSGIARANFVSALLNREDKRLRVVDVLSNRVESLDLLPLEGAGARRHPNNFKALAVLGSTGQTEAFDVAVHRLLGDKVALLEQPVRVVSFKLKPTAPVTLPDLHPAV